MMLLLVCLLLVVLLRGAAAELTYTETIFRRAPEFVSELTLSNVLPHSVVTVTVPYNLQEAVFASQTANFDCTAISRNLFHDAHGETGALRCLTGDHAHDSVTLQINGTMVFEPVRYIVAVCGEGAAADRCSTNKATWEHPSPYDKLMSCQLVAAGVLVFWALSAVFLCCCMFRFRNEGKPSGTEKRRLLARRRMQTRQYRDDAEAVTDGETSGSESGENVAAAAEKGV